MKLILPLTILALALSLTACSVGAQLVPAGMGPAATVPQDGDLSRADEQGAVMVEVTPRSLAPSAGPLQFDVSMNTHSVDLGMDLASLSTLTTDTGVTVLATRWDAPRGGHHVSGTLVFPGTKNGAPFLEGVHELTLTIRDVDATSRIFQWDLQ